MSQRPRFRRIMLATLFFGVAGVSAASGQVRHPLDPLTWQEHWTILEVLRDAGHYTDRTAVPLVSLRQPPKQLVWDWTPGQPFPRSALAVLLAGDQTYEAVIDLETRSLVSFSHVPGAHAPWLGYEFRVMEPDVKAHPDFIAAMQRRGYDDLTFIECGGGPPGYYPIPEYDGRRIAFVVCYDARGVRNTWTRTIEGLTVFYDMGAGEVLRVVDEGVVPVPETVADYHDVASSREPLPPITLAQPLGPGFTVDGHNVEWRNWSFHLRPDFRTGMVLSAVRFRDGDALRPVLYEGHLSEIFVPYMDPATAWYTRNYLDLGEYITGGLAGTMEPGIDCPDNAAWFNQVIILDDGRPHDVPRVLCLFERVTGDALWRHGPDGQPARELVARMTAQLGNYDYVIDWTFQQDGAIRITVGTTGIPAVKMAVDPDARASGSDDAHGRFVARNIVAVNHDHYFNFRLDVDVDGPINRFQADRLEQERLPDSHPRRSVWVHREEVLRREHDARLNMDMHRAVRWRVVSPSVRNHVGYPTSYELVPGHNARTLLSSDDYPRRRAGFIDHHLWVTRHDADERFAAGMYPLLSRPGGGLPAYTADNGSIEDADVVLWYTLGMHHLVRSEDWPVMPVAWHSFELRPFDFFDGNPALRRPRTP